VVDVATDVADALRRLAGTLSPSAWNLDAIQRTVAAQRDRLRSTSGILTPDAVVRIASSVVPDARVTVDAGAHMFAATLLWPADAPNDLLISNGLSTMAFAVPAAIGAALADRARPVVALTGDGGLMMCVGELSTLARERLDVLIIVFDDRRLSLIDIKQRQRRFADAGVGVGPIAWDEVARGFGLASDVARTEPELDAALRAARERGGPALVDAHVDPSGYREILRLVRG
jgi:acetolactate synthase-1/2/3 large subunit